MRKRGFALLLIIGSHEEVFCKDFGMMGQTFPVIEESFLEFLQRKSAEKDLSQKMIEACPCGESA